MGKKTNIKWKQREKLLSKKICFDGYRDEEAVGLHFKGTN